MAITASTLTAGTSRARWTVQIANDVLWLPSNGPNIGMLDLTTDTWAGEITAASRTRKQSALWGGNIYCPAADYCGVIDTGAATYREFATDTYAYGVGDVVGDTYYQFLKFGSTGDVNVTKINLSAETSTDSVATDPFGLGEAYLWSTTTIGSTIYVFFNVGSYDGYVVGYNTSTDTFGSPVEVVIDGRPDSTEHGAVISGVSYWPITDFTTASVANTADSWASGLGTGPLLRGTAQIGNTAWFPISNSGYGLAQFDPVNGIVLHVPGNSLDGRNTCSIYGKKMYAPHNNSTTITVWYDLPAPDYGWKVGTC